MIEKECKKCGETKLLKEFYKNHRAKDGCDSKCKDCSREYNKKWREANPERDKENSRKWRAIPENRQKDINHSKKWREENPEQFSERKHVWYKNNYERCLENNRRWKADNAEKMREYYRTYRKERRAKEPLFKLADTCRARIYGALKRKGYSKTSKTAEMIGCSYEELMIYLESQFVEGMMWENHGDWHIDHIVPLDSAKTEEELIELCHYTNLQPLWAVDNWSKKAKLLHTTDGEAISPVEATA